MKHLHELRREAWDNKTDHAILCAKYLSAGLEDAARRGAAESERWRDVWLCRVDALNRERKRQSR